MPFSRDAFFDAFATYNDAFWPLALMLWVATLIAFTLHPSERATTGGVFGLLAIQWAWSGLAYHAAIFSDINPAAWLFAALFVTQAGLLAWHGVEDQRLEFSSDRSAQVVIGYAIIAYGLLYPVLALAGGHVYPRVPTFGVPCPTTIVTAGFLTLLRGRVPVTVAIVPLIWAVIGGSSAWLFGVPADVGLLVAGAVLAYRTWSPSAAAPASA
jgi:hypothetical protein